MKKKSKSNWGGARKKAKEKYAVPTTVIRVPNPIVPTVRKLIQEFKQKPKSQ